MSKPSPWNPWGLEEMQADKAKKIIKGFYSYRGYECRVDKRGGHDFLVVTDLDIGRNLGGAELLRFEDVEEVRRFIKSMPRAAATAA
jgi:hypothetical protein